MNTFDYLIRAGLVSAVLGLLVSLLNHLALQRKRRSDERDETKHLPRLPAYLAQLVVSEGPQAGKSFTVESASVTIGRDPGTDLCLDSPTISRWHARLQYQDGKYYILDLDSTNGTLVNGQRVMSQIPTQVTDGATVQLGDAMLSFHVVPIAGDLDAEPKSSSPLES